MPHAPYYVLERGAGKGLKRLPVESGHVLNIKTMEVLEPQGNAVGYRQHIVMLQRDLRETVRFGAYEDEPEGRFVNLPTASGLARKPNEGSRTFFELKSLGDRLVLKNTSSAVIRLGLLHMSSAQSVQIGPGQTHEFGNNAGFTVEYPGKDVLHEIAWHSAQTHHDIRRKVLKKFGVNYDRLETAKPRKA